MAKFNLSDEPLNRYVDTVTGTPRERTPLCYALTARQAGVACGVADIIDLLTDHCQGPVTLRGKSDGQRFEAGEAVLVLEGPFGELVALETLCLGILSLSAGAGRIAHLVEAADDGIKIVDASARRYPPELIGPLAIAAAAGGARGATTRAGHTAVIERFGVSGDQIRVGERAPVIFRLHGCVPDGLEPLYSGNRIESAAACHAACPDLPLFLALGDAGREREDCTEALRRFGTALEGVRLDTPADRLHEGGHEKPTRTLEMRILSQARDRRAAQAALDGYGFGPGVTIEALYAIRDLLDANGGRSAQIVVRGFDAEKIRAFRACNAPIDLIETDDWLEFSEFNSRMVRIFEEGQWVACPAGPRAAPVEVDDLPILFQKGPQE